MYKRQLVGHTEFLKVREKKATDRAALVDMSKILYNPHTNDTDIHFDPDKVYDFKLENTIDEKVLLKKFASSLKTGEKQKVEIKVTSTDPVSYTHLHPSPSQETSLSSEW